MKDDGVYIWDMVQAGRRIQEYLAGHIMADLESDSLLFDAVVRQFQVLGQAANKINPAMQQELHNIPWRQIIGLRNVVIHEYSAIDIPTIWITAQEDIPVLLKELDPLFQEILKRMDTES